MILRLTLFSELSITTPVLLAPHHAPGTQGGVRGDSGVCEGGCGGVKRFGANGCLLLLGHYLEISA